MWLSFGIRMKARTVRAAAVVVATAMMGAAVPLAQTDPGALFEAGRREEARAACLRRLEADANDPIALYCLGRATLAGAEARAHFERLLATNPGHELADDALLEVAESDFAGPLGLYRKSRRAYRQLLSRYPDSPHAARAYCRIGQTYLIVRQPDSARVAFTHALKQHPTAAVADLATLGLAQAEDLAGAHSEAARHLAGLGESRTGPLRRAVSRSLKPGPRPAASQGADGVRRSRIWVQVGAFRNAENAGALADRLRAAGLSVQQVEAKARGLHLLFAGPFENRAAAEGAAERIERAEGIKGRIVTRPEGAG